ncbi:unnamed protein product, partial [marine sediment metagenome]
ERKMTCLMVKSLEKSTGKEKEKLLNILSKEVVDDEDVLDVRKIFLRLDVLEDCNALCDEYNEKITQVLDLLKNSMNPPEYGFFKSLQEFVRERDH